MEVVNLNKREEALSLIAAATNHGDLSVKLSSLLRLKDLLSSSIDPSLYSLVFPFLIDLLSSSEPLVRKSLLLVIEEVGLRFLERSSQLVPVLLALLKDEDPGVARQSIVSGMKFFSAVLDDLAWQYHRHVKVERWLEELWMQMNEFKDAVISFLSEPFSVGTRLLALKFLESFVLLFTPDAADSDRLVSGGNKSGFNISCLASGHPILDAAKLISEANRLVATLLDMLQSPSSVPGPLTLAVVNCLAAIARKRADYYGRVLSALLNIQSNSETVRGCHAGSLQYSVRTALLGFLRCTQPVIIESKDKLVRTLRSMNAADAVDQALRHVDKMMRNNERSLREARTIKEDKSSTQVPFTGEPTKRKLMSLDNEEPNIGLEMDPKRTRLSSNGNSSDTVQINELANEIPGNQILSKAPIVNNLNHVEQMIAVIGAILAEGDRATESLELLISQIQPDLLADIVISNMKHLPKTPPAGKSGTFPVNGQRPPLTNVVQGTTTDSTTNSAHSSLTTVQGSVPSSSLVITSLPDLSLSTNLPAESRRDPRRDPRRLDPRRVSGEASLISTAEDCTSVQSRLEGPASANDLPTVPVKAAILSTEHTGVLVQDADVDGINMRPSVVSENEKKLPTEEIMDRAREISSSTEADALVDHGLSPPLIIDERTSAEMSSDIVMSGAKDSPLVLEFDYYSPPASDAPVSEDSCVNLPEVPPYMYLSQQQRRTMTKLSVEKIVRSYKELLNEDLCKTRMSILARLVSWMEADDLVMTMVQEDIVLDYKDQEGHELLMHVLYHLYSLKSTETSYQSPAAAMLYENFLLGVAKGLLDALPASDKSFSRLLGEAPTLTDSVMKLLENLCCPSGPDASGQDIRDDRVTQGLGAVWSLILGRPLNRQACLTIALKCAVYSEDDTRAKAIRLVANKLYPLDYLSEKIEQYATDMLLTAVDSDASQAVPCGPNREVDGDEDPSVRGLQLSESVSSLGNIVKVEQSASQIDSSMSVGEAQRLISLYFALCTKKPSLLQLVFKVYARSGRSVKQAIHRHIPTLLRALGSSYSQLLHIVSDPPSGSDNLLMLVLQVLAEQTTPSPDLINTVKHLYETKLKDATILIPILSSLSKPEVLPVFPRLVDLPLDKFQQALAHILQGSAHTGPALTPAEVLVAIHDIVPEKERIPLKKVMDACGACFEQRTVFTQHVLSKALNQMVDRSPLPLLFMRTVIQAIDAFPTLVDFVMEVLSKLVRRQIWTMPKLYPGFLKCVSQTQPHSFHVLLQLPARQLEGALNKYANLRGPLAAYSGQPNVKSSLPRSTLAVLGLVHESHLIQPHTVSPLHTSDAGSVHGATST